MDAKHARAFYVVRDRAGEKASYRLLAIDPSVDSVRDYGTLADIREQLASFPPAIRKIELNAGSPRVSAPVISPLFGKSGTRPNDDDLLLLRRLADSMYGQGADGNIPAGYTYLGQFIAHELCKSTYIDQSDDEAINGATFGLELGSIYDSSPRLGNKLEMGQTSLARPFDIKRTADGAPQIGNARNDANAALSQTHCSIARFHNAIAESGKFGSFDDIRCQVILCFQAIALHDWLPRLTSAQLVTSILNGHRFAPRGEIRLCPAEAALAVFRIGHSMARHDYAGWNDVVGSGASLNGMIRTTHLGGGLIDGKLPWNWPINWQTLFEFTPNLPGLPLRARKIDTVIEEQLNSIDANFLDTQRHERSLAYRTLWFGARAQLQNGWFIQEQLMSGVGAGEFVLNPDNLVPQSGIAAELFQSGQPLATRPPLWWFILREAEMAPACGGVRGVGARLLAETVIASIEASDISILKGHKVAHGLPGSKHTPPTMANLLQWGNQPLDWYKASYH